MSDEHKKTIVHVAPHDVRPAMHPLVSAAISGGAIDPASLRELLEVQREWEAGEARKAFTRALADLKRDLPHVIARDALVDFTNKAGQRTTYRHASLAVVMDAITEPLTRHGFALSWIPRTTERAVEVTCRLTHAEGHFAEATLSAPADTSGNKSPAQSVASTVTLLSRYTALSLLGIATADMDEPTGERASDDHVDPALNARALRAAMSALRMSREDLEKMIGRPVAEWTSKDLDVLRPMVDEARARQSAPEPKR